MRLRSALAGLPDNPVLERERLTRARSWGMPLGMSLYICSLGGVALLQFSWAISAAPDKTPTAANMARAAFLVASLQLITVFLAVPPVVGSAISSERERGMFDLLLLGSHSPRSLVWCELWAALAYRLLLVVVAAPVLLAVFLYAGLGVGQFLLAELLTFAVAVSVGSVALLLSTVMTRGLGAALSTYGLVFALRFAIITTGSLLSSDVPLNPAPGAPPAVFPLVFATPFYALKALLTGPAPAGAHIGHLVGLLLRRDSDPASWGPVVQPWQAALLGMMAVTMLSMALATRVVAGRRPPSRRRLRSLRRLASTEIHLPLRSARLTGTGSEGGVESGSARGVGMIVAALAATLMVLATATVPGLAARAHGQASQGGATDLSVTATPRWGRSTPGAWTPYLVTMTNRGPNDFEGDVVLVPETVPPSLPPGRKRSPPSVFQPIAVDGAQLTLPRGPGVLTAPGDFPTHRTSISLARGGAVRNVDVLVVEAPFGYRAELRNASGGTVAVAPPTGGPQADQTETIALFGGSDEVAATLRGLDELLGPTSGSPTAGTLTVLPSARDVPSSTLLLSGLQAIVLHGFGTSALGPAQLGALHDFVALGGSLLLTGGSEAAGMLRALPEALVPMAPSGTATVSMAPLADLVDRTTAATATVLTGAVRRGQVMLATPDDLPLVIETDYGAGRVVQLAYDPQAVTLAADPVLVDLAWQQGIGRVLSRFSGGGSNLAPVPGQLWGPALGGMGWPSWPAPTLWLLAGYAFLGGPAVYAVAGARRRRPAIWAVAPAIALAVTLVTGLTPVARGDSRQRAVRVTSAGPGDVALVSSYLGLQAMTGRGQTLTPGGGTAASTVLAPPSLLSVHAVPGATALGSGGGVVTLRGDDAQVRVPTRFGEVRNVNLLSLERRPTIESSLQLRGSGPPEEGGLRLLGTVTNRSARPVRQLRAQLPEGAVARLAEVIPPGATLQVDVALAWPEGILAGARPLAGPEELVLFAAAARAFSRGGQVVVAGIEQSEGGTLAMVTEVVSLRGGERVLALSGASAPVAIAPLATAERLIVQDLDALPGLTRAEISYSAFHNPPEVYDWTTRTWRLLPPGDRSGGLVEESPITPSEVRTDGLVRVRVRLFELGPCCALTNRP